MSLFSVESGKIEITHGSRTVATTDGTLVNALPSAYDFALDNYNVNFPDPPSDYAYHWDWVCIYNDDVEEYGWVSEGNVSFTRKPQERFDSTVIDTVPAGTDFLKMSIRLSRTSAPSHSFNGETMVRKPQIGNWIPFPGSVLLESVRGFSRALHVYKSGNNLRIAAQQSVGPGAGGFGEYGDAQGVGVPPARQSTDGGEVIYDSAAGLVAYVPGTSPYFKHSELTARVTPSKYKIHKWNGSDPASTSDPTDYSSTWQIDLRVSYCRRS